MNNTRDMYYGSYGYGMIPANMNPNINPNMTSVIPQTNYTEKNFNDITERLNRLERQVKRLDQRLNRLETPYQNTNYQEPDNNMYMM